MATTCFICHSSADAAECAKLADCLERRGWKCWIAPRDIPVGSNYPHEIVEGIKGCDSFLILLTNQAAVSPHILRELELACGQGKRIIPLRLPGVELGNSMEYLLASVQWIEVTAGELFSNPQAVVDRIIRGSGTRLVKSPSSGSRGGWWMGFAAVLASGGLIWFFNRPDRDPSDRPLVAPTESPAVVREVVKVVREPQEVPLPPKAVVVAPPAVEGGWICTVSSGYAIEWNLEFKTDGVKIMATGPKWTVDGKKANKTESRTILTMQGVLADQTWKGEYVEDAGVRKFSGTFDVLFSADYQSFEGSLVDEKGVASARFVGRRR